MPRFDLPISTATPQAITTAGGAGSSTLVSSATHFHPQQTAGIVGPANNPASVANSLTLYNLVAAWCWAMVTAGVPAISNSFNIASIVDNGVGDITFTHDRDVSLNGGQPVGAPMCITYSDAGLTVEITAFTAGITRCRARTSAGTLTDPLGWAFAVAGKTD